jgi:hypothetical protein
MDISIKEVEQESFYASQRFKVVGFDSVKCLCSGGRSQHDIKDRWKKRRKDENMTHGMKGNIYLHRTEISCFYRASRKEGRKQEVDRKHEGCRKVSR